MTNTNFPQFAKYACIGDSITWQFEGFDITARIKFDDDTRPDQFDCYSEDEVKRWENNEWFYCGIVLSVSKNGIPIDGDAVSLWGVDCNFSDTSNAYLSEVVQEMEDEAVECAKKRVLEILEKLK